MANLKNLPYLHMYRDRHGSLRCYVRRAGSANIPIPGRVGSREFMDAYRAAVGCEPQRSRRMRHSATLPVGPHVYFLKASDHIKIGTSARPAVRVPAVQVSSPVALSLLAVVPGGADLERAIHNQFRAIRERGEWFKATPELLTFIDQIKADSAAAGSDAMVAIRAASLHRGTGN